MIYSDYNILILVSYYSSSNKGIDMVSYSDILTSVPFMRVVVHNKSASISLAFVESMCIQMTKLLEVGVHAI